MAKPIVILHLSDLHFGANSRFAKAKPEEVGQRLGEAVQEELKRRRTQCNRPDLVVVTGDIAQTAIPSEYQMAQSFFGGLDGIFKLERPRYVFVPGNHDVSWNACKRVAADHADEAFGDDELEGQMNAAKFQRFHAFVETFVNVPLNEIGHPLERGAVVHDFDDLRLSVAALNSCEPETHEHHVPELSGEQAQSLMDYWRGGTRRDWLKIAAIHHNPVATIPSVVAEWVKHLKEAKRKRKLDAELYERFAADTVGLKGREYLKRIAEDCEAQVILHGHHHAHDQGIWGWKGENEGITHVLSAGSLGLKPDKLPHEQPNQIQLVALYPERKPPALKAWFRVFNALAPAKGRVTKGHFVPDGAMLKGYQQRLSLPQDFRQASRRAGGARKGTGPSTRAAAFKAFGAKYLAEVKENYGYLKLLGIPECPDRPRRIDAAFISLSLAGEGGSGQVRDAEALLPEHAALVIEGEAGAGKTTLLQWEAVRCCDGYRHTDRWDALDRDRGIKLATIARTVSLVPFFIKLRELRLLGDGDVSPAFPEEEDWVKLSTPHLKPKPPKGWLEHLLEEGRALLLLDGLDELPAEKRPEFWGKLQALFARLRGLHFRVTSRFFPHDGENAPQWQPPVDPNTEKTVPTVKVQPLAPERIDMLIDQWHGAAVAAEETPKARELTARDIEGYADGLKARLRKREYRRVFELAETPFLCAAICLVNRHWGQLLPERRHQLYRMLVVALLSLRDKMRQVHGSNLYDNLGEEVLVKLHSRLALDMMRGMGPAGDGDGGDGEGYLIEAERAEVLEWLQGYIETIPALADTAEPASLLDGYMVPRCGLLREPSEGRLDFRHRALQEYLAGTAAVQTGQIDDLAERAHDDRWRDTVILAAGGYNVSEQEAIRLIRAIVKQGTGDKGKICHAVAVACLETAWDKVDTETQKLVLAGIRQLIPPRNSEDAKTLSAAGDHVVGLLPFADLDPKDTEAVVACAETLARIGTDAAQRQLKRGYWSDARPAVAVQVLRCPDLHPLDMPVVVGSAAKTGTLKVPEFARPYVPDVIPLKVLTDLASLDLGDCDKVADLWPIGKLAGLRELNLGGCAGVADSAPLGALPGLTALELGDCVNVDDLSPLERLTALGSLDLSRCAGVSDLAPLAGLANLRKLSLRCCENVTDVSSLAKLTRLEELDLSYCGKVTDVSTLQGLPNLRMLEMLGCPAKPFKPLKAVAPGTPGMDFIEPITGMKMVWVEGDTFQMGSPEGEQGHCQDESPVHPVTLDGFWMSATPVTQAQYAAVVGENPSRFEGGERPVECVSWNDATAFCEELGKEFALPTEAQWEYGCRAGGTGRFCFGDGDNLLRHYAWYGENSGEETHAVGLKRPNRIGLYDMHGNVWEWCRDWFDSKFYAKSAGKNPCNSTEAGYRVLRGGSWINYANFCRSAYRFDLNAPAIRGSHLGFRVARTP